MIRRSAVTLALLSSVLFAASAEVGAAPGEVAAVIPDKLKASTKKLIAAISGGGENGYRVPDIESADFKVLLAAKWLDVNPPSKETKDGVTSMVVRLNANGAAKAAELAGTPATARAPSTRPNLSPDDFVIKRKPVPDFASQRSLSRVVYPFEKLAEVGDFFFLPQPEGFEGKDFAGTKQGTVGGQNRRAKEAWDKQDAATRPAQAPQYKVYNDTEDGKKGATFQRIA